MFLQPMAYTLALLPLKANSWSRMSSLVSKSNSVRIIWASLLRTPFLTRGSLQVAPRRICGIPILAPSRGFVSRWRLRGSGIEIACAKPQGRAVRGPVWEFPLKRRSATSDNMLCLCGNQTNRFHRSQLGHLQYSNTQILNAGCPMVLPPSM